MKVMRTRPARGKVISCVSLSPTVEPLYNDSPEIRTSIRTPHCLWSQLDRVVYKTTPEMKTPH